MEENLNPIPEEPRSPVEFYLAAHGREFIFGGVILLLSILMCNFVFYGGFHLGFAVIAAAAILCSWIYLRKNGGKFGWYEKSLLILSLVIAGGFGRSDDGFVKFVMLLFLFVAVNLALCLAAGQNRRSPQSAASLLDAPRAFFRLGMGNLGSSGRGLAVGIRQGGTATRRIGAVGTGLLVSVPILAVMIILLMNADAAFEGLMDLLPEIQLREYIQSAFWGLLLGWILYSRGISLAKEFKPAAAGRSGKGVNALTVNTVLIMVGLVYVVYLLSQLAYFSGGLSGILPEGYTMAEYARRGFFEMAWLCTINLGLLCGSIWLIRGEGSLPRLTKIAGAFIGAITIFLICTASAKMFLYIGSYGLTWSRVVTEVIMLWLALTTVLVTIRLFLPGFGYMKAIVLTAMVLGALVFWVDVNTLVASYNVNAYRSGRLENLDVDHLATLGSGGIPYLVELTEDADPEIAARARDRLSWQITWNSRTVEDFRHWNADKARAVSLLEQYRTQRETTVNTLLTEQLGLEVPMGSIFTGWGDTVEWENGARTIRVEFDPDAHEVFVARIQEAGWPSAPLSAELRTVMNREPELFQAFRLTYTDNAGRKGYYFFLDLHPEATDPTNPEKLLTREEYRFILAYYDPDAARLCFFQVDRPAEPQAE